jgi:hypothetical protein
MEMCTRDFNWIGSVAVDLSGFQFCESAGKYPTALQKSLHFVRPVIASLDKPHFGWWFPYFGCLTVPVRLVKV